MLDQIIDAEECSPLVLESERSLFGVIRQRATRTTRDRRGTTYRHGTGVSPDRKIWHLLRSNNINQKTPLTLTILYLLTLMVSFLQNRMLNNHGLGVLVLCKYCHGDVWCPICRNADPELTQFSFGRFFKPCPDYGYPIKFSIQMDCISCNAEAEVAPVTMGVDASSKTVHSYIILLNYYAITIRQ